MMERTQVSTSGLGNETKRVTIDAWEVIIKGVFKDKEKQRYFEKTKLKTIVEGLSLEEDDDAALIHFMKYCEYYLPRSKLNQTLICILDKVKGYKESYPNDPKKARKMTRRLIGYMNWSLEAVAEIKKKNISGYESDVGRMIASEFSLMGENERSRDVSNSVIDWLR